MPIKAAVWPAALLLTACGGGVDRNPDDSDTSSSHSISSSPSSSSNRSNSSANSSSSSSLSPSSSSSSSLSSVSNSSIFSSASSAAPNNNELSVIYALNIGANEGADLNGIRYERDDFYRVSGAENGVDLNEVDIEGTSEDALYQSQRYGNYIYELPVTNGIYNTTVHLAESWAEMPNQRLMSIVVEGQVLLDNADIYTEFGGRFQAIDLEVNDIEVTDESLTIEFSASENNATASGLLVTSAEGERREPEPMPEPEPGGASAGCDIGAGAPQNLQVPNVLLTLPEGYDGTTPTPLVFAFHGRNRNTEEMRNDDARTVGSALEQNYVMAFIKSAGGGYEMHVDYPRFEAALEQLLTELCIDTGSIFAMGISNGAQFIAAMLGNDGAAERRFAGIAPIASSYQNPPWPAVPALVIHGENDTVRAGLGDADGSQDIQQFVESNNCSNNTQPYTANSCSSLTGGGNVNPGCREYVGCDTPTVFCQHDDPHYQNTNHGWPCFANEEIFKFFESLR
ncbi:MAG TPA: malectin domain-containing carbohydrate-binding protein [Marinagarivorans sp.]